MARALLGFSALTTSLSVLVSAVAGEAFAADAAGQVDQTSVAAVTEVIVTARRREERLQDVPLPVSVVDGALVADSGSFNVNRLKELIPSVQFYSTNPRNSAANIRGLGAPFGLTNDGIEQGVGLYVDGVYFARPAAATLDFIDVERIEVLRGPQGTLYGKNTTAGAINVTTRRPSFTPQTDLELSYGNYGFIQAKASISGPITENLAGRLSFSGTQRDGLIYNVAKNEHINDLNNLGFKGQLLYKPRDGLEFLLSGDFTRQRPNGYAQVVAGVAPTLRPANRQWAGIIADLNYAPPSYDAFDRLTDSDTPWRSKQDLGGGSLTINWDVGPGTLTSITAYRFWDWDPSNDRDFVGLPITTQSAATSRQMQWSQELRYAGDLSDSLGFVVGAFAFRQKIASDPVQTQVQGSAAARFLLAPSALAATPGLLDGYGQETRLSFKNESAALFGQLDWKITERLRVLPGLRLNYDKKEVFYDNQVFGGLQTTNPALIALQRSILSPQTYAADVSDTNVSGQVTVAYEFSPQVNAYATYATSFKSVGLNLAGVPTDASGAPALSAATVKPEDVTHIELGLKTQPLPGVIANFAAYETTIQDYQAQVQNAAVGVLRGYLANADEVRVRGFEFDGRAALNENLNLYAALAYTDAVYTSFADAPAPIELTGGPAAVDISGSRLPGVSKWAGSVGGEYTQPGELLGRSGDYFVGVDASYRSSFSSSATPSEYLNVKGYGLVNARVGFRVEEGWDVTFWVRNLADKDYYELLSAAPGGSGLIVGQPGDPRTYGVTIGATF